MGLPWYRWVLGKKDILTAFCISSPKACQCHHPHFAAGKTPPEVVQLATSFISSPSPQIKLIKTKLGIATSILILSPWVFLSQDEPHLLLDSSLPIASGALLYHLALFSPASPHQHVKTFKRKRQNLLSLHIHTQLLSISLTHPVKHFESMV